MVDALVASLAYNNNNNQLVNLNTVYSSSQRTSGQWMVPSI